ncbi:peptidyl-prolyl cis-trans isomerase [Fredinandcohnia sp. QZ13]|uniref:peptidyl-prolyl cis-trans isomerase n=1 Tax=Fredinandcohnia sp. QZ13 TaxID=3073144 RepID=UPI0028532BF8|nr:peptidyl-prolyl cis-trans isomerase [Fredinandcohnia sp. QZ13]MDR4888529.1 peptidyl-prolyl cis-trans isomerase [Fredinandcohnia sp. QZ13]
MNQKILWSVIIALVITNCLSVVYFMTDKSGMSQEKTIEASKPVVASGEEEVVATIGETGITRQQWLHELEDRYGKQILEGMIDEEVVRQMTKKYDITLSEDAVERELTLIKTMYNTIDNENIDDKHWQEQIELSILLEELLTKDAIISEEEMKHFYEENKHLYEIPKSYHISHIVVKTKEAAEQVRQELDNGSSFAALAMEKSTDEFSTNRGGELGFVNAENGYAPDHYLDVAEQLKPNEWSEPVEVEGGYAVIILHEVIDAVTYSYDDVKGQIKRQIAIDQMNGAISVEPFWKELGVKWFFENHQ